MVPTSTLGIFHLGIRNLLYTKFGSFLSLPSVNQGVVFYPKDVAQREFAEKVGANLTNFISLWSNNLSFSWERQRSPVGRRGMGLAIADSEGLVATTARAVPVDVNYEMTFWVSELDDLLRLTEEFFFWVHENPSLEITINGFEMEPYLRFKEIVDASTINNMYKVGKYWVYTCNFKMDGWIPRFDTDWTIQKITLTGYTGDTTDKVQVFQQVIPE